MSKIELSTFETNKVEYAEGSRELQVFKFITCGDLSPFDNQKQSLQ
jgi:hypothetical protein